MTGRAASRDPKQLEELLEAVKFDEKGLVGCICQDADSGEVLMFAYMNQESLARTVSEGVMCYWSRSRQSFWVKGESSGNTQEVVELRLDCDGDCLLARVRQRGAACHTGYRSCFYRVEKSGDWEEDGERVFTQEEMNAKYGKK